MLTVYKITWSSSSPFHIHAGVYGTMFLVPDIEMWEGLRGFGVDVSQQGTFGGSNLQLVTHQEFIDNAKLASLSPDGVFSITQGSEKTGQSKSTWSVVCEFEILDDEFSNLKDLAIISHQAKNEFSKAYEDFYEKHNFPQVHISGHYYTTSNKREWSWWVKTPERLDSERRFSSKEEALADWQRVAQNKGIEKFEIYYN